MKRSSKMKQKAFFIIFKGLLLKQIKQIFLEGESPTLIEIYQNPHDNSGNSLKELFVRMESTINLQTKPEPIIPLVNFILKGKNS